jgi:hypothetical protein
MPKASGDRSSRTFAKNMSTAPTYWTPFSPQWRWPIRILGIVSLSGAFASFMSGQYRPGMATAFLGIYFLWTSWQTPTLKTLSRSEIHFRRISIVFLTITILGLFLIILTSLART